MVQGADSTNGCYAVKAQTMNTDNDRGGGA